MNIRVKSLFAGLAPALLRKTLSLTERNPEISGKGLLISKPCSAPCVQSRGRIVRSLRLSEKQASPTDSRGFEISHEIPAPGAQKGDVLSNKEHSSNDNAYDKKEKKKGFHSQINESYRTLKAVKDNLLFKPFAEFAGKLLDNVLLDGSGIISGMKIATRNHTEEKIQEVTP